MRVYGNHRKRNPLYVDDVVKIYLGEDIYIERDV